MARETTWIGGMADIGTARDGSPLAMGVWFDPGAGVVASTSFDPAMGDLGALLAQACKTPSVGAPRRPAKVRVATRALADQVERSGLGIAVEVGPTPEVDGLAASFLAYVGDSAAAGPGRTAPPKRNFFGQPWRFAPPALRDRAHEVGAKLVAGAPWDKAGERERVRVDAPTLQLDGAVALLAGRSSPPFGFALFGCDDDVQVFLDHDAAGTAGTPGATLNIPYLFFEVTPARRRKAPPTTDLIHVSPTWDATHADAGEHAALIAVGEALARFERGRTTTVGPVTVGLLEGAGATVMPITGAAGPPARRLERNDPCWCGSGKKYKKCHLDADLDADRAGERPGPRAGQRLDGPAPSALLGGPAPSARAGGPVPSAAAGRSRWHDTIAAMYARLSDWAESLWPGWVKEAATDPGAAPPELWRSVALFAAPCPGSGGRRTAAEVFRQAHGAALGRNERRWLDANIETAWTSYWSVVEVVPGRTVTLRDIFSGEVRTVAEARASLTLVAHDLLCGRVVTLGDEAYLDASHPRTFGPREAVFLREQLAIVLGLNKTKAVPVAKLRTHKVTLGLLAGWKVALRADAAASPPILQNTDGEALLLVTERFTPTAPLGRIIAAIRALDGVTASGPGATEWTLARPGNAMIAAWDNTTVANLRLEGATLVVETNSLARADAVRARLVAALGAALGAGVRTTRAADELMAAELGAGERTTGSVDDLMAAVSTGRVASGPTPAVPYPPEVQAAVAAMKERSYAAWPDAPLPALGGQTARAAVRTAAGRKQVTLLIDEMERLEQREPPPTRYDFNVLRRALGLLPPG